jgi:alcohol dehydrogenase (NADP+)
VSTGSTIGSPEEMEEMLQLAVDRKIKPWVETVPTKDANRGIVHIADGKARYRYFLVNELPTKL